MELNCSICLENFVDAQILNCGHSFCLTCVRALHQHSPRNAKCPECRQRITGYNPNYALNNVNNTIENQENTTEKSMQSKLNLFKKKRFIIHDNSGSMANYQDGNILEFHSNGKIVSKGNRFRYEEANQRSKLIVEQTLKDNQEVTIYLLNQISFGQDIIEDIDYVTINRENYQGKKHILDRILSPDNIGGVTPLPDIVRLIRNEIISYKNKQIGKGMRKDLVKWTIIFNTDGEPNDGRNSINYAKLDFEKELRKLIQSVHCEIIFNVITDEESVVEYYNDLDINLNKGYEETATSVDVLDDWKNEALESQGKNPCIVYSIDIHKKRISGGNHITFDMIDEETMNMFYTNIFIKIILDRSDIPDVDDPNYFNFLENIVKDKKVYDITTKTFKPVVDINLLKMKYYYEKTVKIFSKKLNNNKISIILILVFLVTTLFAFV
jgi:hypothetical protein